MKSSVFLILFAFLISCTNLAALKSFQAKYPHASSVKWEKDGDVFDVEFILDEQEYEAEFDKSGKWLETEKEIKISDIPEAIQKVLNTEYSGYEIKEAEYTETSDYGIIYEVVIQQGEQKIEIYFYPDGMILKEETEKSEKVTS